MSAAEAPPATETPSTTRIILANLPILYGSFLVSALSNILPQQFLARTAPGEKALWLSVSLLLGAVAALAGVRASERAGGTALTGVMAAAALAAALFAASAAAVGLAAFVVLSTLSRGAGNLLVGAADRAGVLLAAGPRRALGDQVSTVYRLAGMVAAPPLFVALYDHRGALVAILLGLGAATVAAARLLPPLAPRPAAAGDAKPEAEGPLPSGVRLILGATTLVIAAMYAFGANVIYLLGRILPAGRAEPVGALFVLLLYLAAAAAVMLLPAALGRPRVARIAGRSPTPEVMLMAAIIVGGIEAHRLGGLRSEASILIGAAVAGAAYGWTSWVLRRWVTAFAPEGGHLLIAYNNQGNVAALVAFAALVPLNLLSQRLGWSPGAVALRTVEALAVLAVAVAVAAGRVRVAPAPAAQVAATEG